MQRDVSQSELAFAFKQTSANWGPDSTILNVAIINMSSSKPSSSQVINMFDRQSSYSPKLALKMIDNVFQSLVK